MNRLPNQFRQYFWDVDFKKIDLKKHQTYVIERLLEYGDLKTYRWLVESFPSSTIKKVAAKSRRISAKTRKFWQGII